MACSGPNREMWRRRGLCEFAGRAALFIGRSGAADPHLRRRRTFLAHQKLKSASRSAGRPLRSRSGHEEDHQGGAGHRVAVTRVDMRLRRTRSRRSSRIAALVTAALIFVLLPYDNPLWLALRFNATRLGIYIHSSYAGDSWLYRLPEFPVDIAEDVGLIVKTGYGTKYRLSAALKALETGFASRDIVVIADFTPSGEEEYFYHGNQVQVHNIFAMMLEDESLNWMRSTPRFEKYLKMTAALTDGNLEVAEEIGKSAGWELDAIKV